MGCEWNFESLNATTRDEAIKEGLQLIEDAKYDYGHAGYTGSFAECEGVKFVEFTGKLGASVEDWLVERCEKWGPMLVTEVNGLFWAGALCSS